MKKLLILSVILLLFLSCSKSSKDAAPDYTNNHPQLIGIWKYTEYSDDLISSIIPDPHIIINGYTIKFNPDGTFVSSEFADHPNGTYLVTGNNLALTYSPTATSNLTTNIREISSVTTSELKMLALVTSGVYRLGERYEKVLTPTASGKKK